MYKDETCTFHLFNVYTPIIYHVEYVLVNPAQFGLGDAIRDAAIESLNKLAKRIGIEFPDNPKHKLETIARFEVLIFGVKEFVQERNMDVIVMGTQGATGAKEVLFGSNTVHLFKNVKCPILAIPSDFKYDHRSKSYFQPIWK